MPQQISVYVLAAPDLIPETWRVVSITEQNGTQAQITAMSYRADKYDAIENDVVLGTLPISILTGVATAPSDLNISESLYLVTSAVIGTRITVSWSGSAAYFELQYRKQNGNWQLMTTSSSSLDIAPVDIGIYEFSLTAVNAVGRRSAPVTATQEIYGKTTPPPFVDSFKLIEQPGGIQQFFWSMESPPLDLFAWEVRYSQSLNSTVALKVSGSGLESTVQKLGIAPKRMPSTGKSLLASTPSQRTSNVLSIPSRKLSTST